MFFLASIVTEYLRFFFYRAIPINLFQSITNSQTAEKVMSHHISPNGSVGVSQLMPSSGGISPLTCTIFDPIYFGTILRNQISHISPTSLKKFIMGNYLDFALKIAHRGNTGSHKGKRTLFCMFG